MVTHICLNLVSYTGVCCAQSEQAGQLVLPLKGTCLDIWTCSINSVSSLLFGESKDELLSSRIFQIHCRLGSCFPCVFLIPWFLKHSNIECFFLWGEGFSSFLSTTDGSVCIFHYFHWGSVEIPFCSLRLFLLKPVLFLTAFFESNFLLLIIRLIKPFFFLSVCPKMLYFIPSHFFSLRSYTPRDSCLSIYFKVDAFSGIFF